jgi:division protein CdvB (Snf7/Vps24/ESCRT-III family)
LRRLENRIKKIQYVKHQLQSRQVAFEDAIANSELAEDLDRVAILLEESNELDLNPLLNNIMNSIYRLNETMEESIDQTESLQNENDEAIQSVTSYASKQSKDDVQDLLELIFQTTEIPVKKPAAVKKEEEEEETKEKIETLA